ncbi:MAG: tRNA 2-thiouridine(34) synthase MnmA [Ferrimicrobium sp.]
MAKVLVAMSGGVDSSVAAALLKEDGHDVVGVTMKLWGGVSDTGCCSVSDVEDARYVAQQLGIAHRVFNMTDAFTKTVVSSYVEAYARGRTPNPCIECNRSIKFDLLITRARQLGFDLVATGHHARVVSANGRSMIARGYDSAKDQSYVLSMVPPEVAGLLLLPVGSMTKNAVRSHAARLGLRTAAKPDSLEVCFISRASSKERFVGERVGLHSSRVIDMDSGRELTHDLPFETVTVGQRRHIGGFGDGLRRYVIDKDPVSHTVQVGTADRLLVRAQPVEQVVVHCGPTELPLTGLVQSSAHGQAVPATLSAHSVTFESRHRRVAPGQTVAFYRGDLVVASAVIGEGALE